jgi:phospholipid-binding lipoprotein MlaA
MKSLPLAVLATCALVVSSVRTEASDSSRIRVYSVTQEGAVAVELGDRNSKKRNSGTLFLESAVPENIRVRPAAAKPAPKPKATPKPKLTPKPKKEKPAPAPPLEAPITITKKSPAPKPAPAPAASKKNDAAIEDDWDDYADVPVIADPIEPVNRGIFWFNHQLYNFVVRPVSKVYTTVFPKPVRRAVNNAYDNAEYPVRFTNHLLQADFKNADLETRKFVVNSVAGVGGILKVSDRIPAIADVPSTDTGKTFAKWGIGHGPYIVWPFLGPRSLRDTFGLAGDVALNPFTWVSLAGAAPAIALPLTTPNTVRNAHNRLEVYDIATKDSIDPYVAIRSGYLQNRDKPRKP